MSKDTQLVVPKVGDSSQAQRHQFWKKVLSNYRRSQLTLRQFSQHHGLKYAQAKRWSYRLGRLSRPRKGEVHNPGLAKVVLTADSTPSSPSLPVASGSVRLEKGDIRIYVPCDVDARTLSRVLQVLAGQLRC